MLVDIRFRHDLHVQRPLREVALLDRAEQILLVGLARLGDDGLRLAVGMELETLLCLEVEFDPAPLVLGVDE